MMKRHYFICSDLDDLDRIEVELEQSGVSKPQIHVLSQDDAGVETHEHLHNIESVLKQDVIHGTITGALFGLLAGALALGLGYLSNLPETYTWMPFYFLAIVLFGFVTWSGGFYGIQTPHKEFRRFQKDLAEGKHVFIVDVDPEQEAVIARVEARHPSLKPAGTGSATPRWIVKGQQNIKDITTTTFP
jgi:hypothetical protein